MGGIGRTTASLARTLPEHLHDHEILFLLGARRPEHPLSQAPNAQEVPTNAAMIDPEFEQIRLPDLLLELGVDLYHGTCFAVPLGARRVKRVATVHDVVFRRHPDMVDPGLRAYLDRWTDVSCEVADAIVTVSEFSKGEIAELYSCDEDKICVVPNAVDEEFFRIERRFPKGPPYVLYVGAIEAKKNIEPLLRGFAALLDLDKSLRHHLVLVGGAGGAAFDLEAAVERSPSIKGRVHATGHVPEEKLRELYAGADAFAYLSEYEGFGLPPLEAMSVGIPCVVSKKSSLPEITNGAALEVDPHKPEAVAKALKSAIRDTRLSADLVRRGFSAARRFAWPTSARTLADLYRRILAPVSFKVLSGGAA
jgi:glycosyltransferase involved in cell wall biosynthesis